MGCDRRRGINICGSSPTNEDISSHSWAAASASSVASPRRALGVVEAAAPTATGTGRSTCKRKPPRCPADKSKLRPERRSAPARAVGTTRSLSCSSGCRSSTSQEGARWPARGPRHRHGDRDGRLSPPSACNASHHKARSKTKCRQTCPVVSSGSPRCCCASSLSQNSYGVAPPRDPRGKKTF